MGQTASIKAVLANACTYRDEPAHLDTVSNVAAIVVTAKSCIGCFQTLCDYLAHNGYNKYKVCGIVFMKQDYLAIIPVYKQFMEEIKCLDGLYFYYTDSLQDDFLKKIIVTPSPQLILKSDNKYRYLSYGETIRLN